MLGSCLHDFAGRATPLFSVAFRFFQQPTIEVFSCASFDLTKSTHVLKELKKSRNILKRIYSRVPVYTYVHQMLPMQ